MAAAAKKEKETFEQKREREKLARLINNRRDRFKELLGEDCEFVDMFTINTHISPWDVKHLLDQGCPKELIPEILL